MAAEAPMRHMPDLWGARSPVDLSPPAPRRSGTSSTSSPSHSSHSSSSRSRRRRRRTGEEEEGGHGGSVVVVTGSSGFLGLHVVALLRSACVTGVRKVVLVDLAEPQQGHFSRVDGSELMGGLRAAAAPQGAGDAVTTLKLRGDVCDEDFMRGALEGAHVLLHTCSLIDLSSGQFGQSAATSRVNVDATRMLLRLCRELGVRACVYTSTREVLSPDLHFGPPVVLDLDDETPYPSRHLFPVYGSSKARAEQLVLAAGGRAGDGAAAAEDDHDDELATVSVRPLSIWGERDYSNLGKVMQLAHAGKLSVFFGDARARDTSVHHFIYAGNCAYSHLLAAEAALRRPHVVRGQAYLFCDETPIRSLAKFYDPFLALVGADRPLMLPWWLGWVIALLMEVAELLLRPIRGRQPVPLTRPSLRSVCASLVASDEKARRDLSYQPIFSHGRAHALVRDYFARDLANSIDKR